MLNKIIYRIGLFFRNRRIIENFEFLLESQYWSRDQLKSYQFNKLSTLISDAYDKCPYYRKLFLDAGITPQDIKSISDIQYIPTTSKTVLLNNKSDIQIRINSEKTSEKNWEEFLILKTMLEEELEEHKQKSK